MKLRLAILWTTGAALVVAGIAASWSSAVGTAERYAQYTLSGQMDDSGANWTYMLSRLALPLVTAGLCTLLITLALHAALWWATPREP